MPLIVKDYNWEETPSSVAISVPLKGVKKEKADIFTINDFVKISFPPYLFEIALYKPIDTDRSTAYIEDGIILLKLVKQDEELWGQLCSDIMNDKIKMHEKRAEALLLAQQKAETDFKKRQEIKRENDKLAINKSMQLDQEERDRIEAIKEAEKQKANAELERWKEEQRIIAQKEKELLEEEARKEAELRRKELMEAKRKQRLLEKEQQKENMFAKSSVGDGVRQHGKIEVTFTPRVFPTALRESTKPLEDEWLKKQAEARRVYEIEDKDLTEEERNPEFMKDKGDNFFRMGDFYGAINAYTHAIRLSQGKMPSLYSNRAACHLKVRNLMKAVEDSSKALDLLTPPVPQNASSRCKAHVRRGTAFCELELFVEGLLDYEAALKIEPENSGIQADVIRIRKIIQGQGTSTG